MLSLWGHIEPAQQLLSYWLRCFIFRDGSVQFQGPAISEYGQLLTTVRSLVERGAGDHWLDHGKHGEWPAGHRSIIRKMVSYITELATGSGRTQLVVGCPEDDRRNDIATYFHNNAWLVRGLRDWAALEDTHQSQRALILAAELERLLLEAIRDVWPKDPKDWWLPPAVESSLPESGPIERPACVTETVTSSYTNYRYWPELLSSRVLPRDLADRIVYARLNGGGQFLGMTRFRHFIDDWPLHNWLDGLWHLGYRDDFLLSLWGHIYYSQAKGHLTAYEAVRFPPGRMVSPYCLPCQLVAVRAAAKIALAD